MEGALALCAVAILVSAAPPAYGRGTDAHACRATTWRPCRLDLLRPDGIAALRFGASVTASRTAIDGLLHQQGGKAQPSGSCKVDEQITWTDAWTASGQPDLTLYFEHGGFVGYQVGAPQMPRHPPGGWVLSTPRGLRVGESLGVGRRRYGRALALSASQGGTWVLRTADGTIDGYAWTDSGPGDVNWQSLIASIDAGDTGCPAASP